MNKYLRLRFRSRLRKGFCLTLSLASAFFYFFGCQTTPVTGRSQMIFYSEESEKKVGEEIYKEFLKEAKISKDPVINEDIRRVGTRIAKAADRPDYKWEFTVIEDNKTANAFALPGGKVAVYTGILKFTKDDAGLATVLAHEVAHAMARHGSERTSNELLGSIGMIGATVALATRGPQVLQGLYDVYGIGLMLPFSRKQELEADRIGLIVMAKAGYNPEDAIGFWERMAGCQLSMIGRLCFKSYGIPDFLSTHPSDEERMRQILDRIPEAKRYYHPEETG
ncbi:MAG: M48 family metallopeptidase [Nitrospirae bacterium]|nr:M48 family metallopeptidase [Nitrospirota bacterium]